MGKAENGHLRAVMGTVQAGNLVSSAIRAELPEPVPSLTAWRVLDLLARRKDQIPLSELTAVAMSRPNTTEVTNRLEDKGLVDKDIDSNNGRYRVVGITPEGREVLESTVPVIDEVSASLMLKLGQEEVRELGRLTTTLLEKSGQTLWLPHSAR